MEIHGMILIICLLLVVLSLLVTVSLLISAKKLKKEGANILLETIGLIQFATIIQLLYYDYTISSTLVITILILGLINIFRLVKVGAYLWYLIKKTR